MGGLVLCGCSVLWIVVHATGTASSEVTSLNHILRLFVGDMDFLNPACSGLDTKNTVFALNVGTALVGVVLLCAANLIRYLRAKAKAASPALKERHFLAKTSSVSLAGGFVSAVMAGLWFFAAVLITRAVDSISCDGSEGTIKLFDQLDVVCDCSYSDWNCLLTLTASTPVADLFRSKPQYRVCRFHYDSRFLCTASASSSVLWSLQTAQAAGGVHCGASAGNLPYPELCPESFLVRSSLHYNGMLWCVY